MIEFFMPIAHVPSVTYQEKEVTAKNGRIIFYEPSELREARMKLTAHLAKHRPQKPLDCGIRLTVRWCFRDNSFRRQNGEYRITKPDTDNLQKLLKDCMTELGFWTDDSRVASELCEKFWVNDSPSGIYIRIEELP